MDDEDEVAAGFRFYPTEEELVSFYLHNKLKGTTPQIDRVIPFLDIYDYNPSDLPRLGGQYSPAEGEQWFFFGRRHGGGGRPNRLTKWGYWKATGSPSHVYSSQNRVIARKKTMVFYVGRAPNATKTPWKMIEYNAFSSSKPPQLIEEVYLCRIYRRSKTLGAFDRLPPPSVEEPGYESAVRHTLNKPAFQEITDGSSSSGDNAADLSQVVESGKSLRPENSTDGEVFWDFEVLNWSDLLSND